jgi:chromosome segregation ATPase
MSDERENKPRALTQGGPRRHQTATERDEQGFAARRMRDARVPAIFHEDITGRYEIGAIDQGELERLRAERDAAQRQAIADLRADLKTTDKLVSEHNTKLEIGVLPVVARIPRELEAIRTAQAQLDTAFNGAIVSIDDAIASMSRQLQQHSAELHEIKSSQRTHSDRIATVERTADEHRVEIAKLKKQRSTDVVVGSWVRRNLTSIIVTAVSAIAGLVGGYLSSKFGVTP